MAIKITANSDPRIAADVEARARVHTAIQGLLDRPAEEWTADTDSELAALRQEFDGLSQRIQGKVEASAMDADIDFGRALLEETHGMAQAGDIRQEEAGNRPPTADEIIAQTLTSTAMIVPAAHTRLRGHLVHDLLPKLYQDSPTMKEVRQYWMGQANGDTSIRQDVIGRVGTSGVENIGGTGDSSIIPQGVEAAFVEVLRNINGPHKAGCEMWYTPGLEPIRLPKGMPAAVREPGTTTAVPAERATTADIRSDDSPTFSSINTQPREYSALFPVDRSAQLVTPVMLGAKVGELLARQLGAIVSQQATTGTTEDQAEGVLPLANTAAGTNLPAYLKQTGQDAGFTTVPAGGAPTYASITAVMGAKKDFPMSGGMGDVWLTHKTYAFSAFIGMRGSDGHPIFKSDVTADAAPIDTLMGRSIIYNDYSPAANANEKLMAVFGDFYNGAVCRRAGDIELATDSGGTYFAKNQIAYRGLMYEAFVIKNSDQFSYLRGTT